MIRRLCAGLGVLAAVSAAATAAAAPPGIQITASPTAAFPTRSYVLSLPSGRRLQSSSVHVQENGQPVRGLSVAPAGAAATNSFATVLAMDASNSMRGRPIADAMAATRAFAAGRNVNQRLALLTFNGGSRLALPFTTSQAAIDKALARQPALGSGTRLYDGVSQAIAQLQLAGVDAGTVVVLSDGHDTGSSIGLTELAQHARAAGVRVFTVALASPTSRPGALQKLAALTGGSYSLATSSTDLRRIFGALGLRLAREYLVSWQSTAKPGEPVHVKLSVDSLGTRQASYTTPGLPSAPPPYHPKFSDRVWRSGLTMLAIALLIPLMIAAVVFPSAWARGSTVRARLSDFVSMPQQRRDRKPMASRIFVTTERRLETAPWWSRFTAQLELADIRIPPVQILVGTLVVTFFTMWILSLIFPLLALLGLGVPLVVRGLIRGRIDRRRRTFGDQLPDNLDVLASGLRAGHGFIGALAVVVTDAPEPSQSEFKRIVGDEQLGVSLHDALQSAAKRMENRDLEQVALVAALQSETGGNSAEVLDRVTQNIRDRAELRRLVRTLTAQGRLARWVVTGLPVGLLLIISALNPTYMKPLFTHTGGQIALLFAGLMIVAGSVVIGKIVDIKI